MIKRSLFWNTFAATLLGSFTIVWFYCGLPYNFSADLPAHDAVLKSMSYADLIRYTLNPLTPAWFFMTEIGYLRPIYYLFVKFFFDHFGASLIPVHIAVAIGLGFLSAFFFLVCAWITRKKWLAWLIVLFYAGIPTNAPMIAGYLALDLQYLHSLISIAALVCFALLTFPTIRKQASTTALTLGWILLTWISIKWKSSEKLLPFIYLAFLFIKIPGLIRLTGIRKPLLLLGINLAMFILVVPLQKAEVTLKDPSAVSSESSLHIYTAKDQRMFRSDPANIFYRSFFATNQPNPLLKISSDDMPYSLAGNLGLLLFIFFLTGMAGSFWMIRRRRRLQQRRSSDLLEHAFVLTTLWFFVVLASFASGAPLEEVRYLNFAIVPMILLLIFLIRFLFDIIGAAPWKKRILSIACLVMFAIPIAQNFLILSKWVGHFGGMQHVLFEAEKTIYEKVHGPAPFALAIHYSHPQLERDHTFVCWYRHPADWKTVLLERAGSGAPIFVLSRTDDDAYLKEIRALGFSLSEPKIFRLIDAKPLMFGFARHLGKFGLSKKMKKREVLLYEAKITEGSSTKEAQPPHHPKGFPDDPA